MQRLSGQGMAFLEIDGHVVEYDLLPGQSLYIDTGHLAAMTDTVSLDVEKIKGVKNVMLGGEGLFNTKVTGPRAYLDPDHALLQAGGPAVRRQALIFPTNT